MPKKEVGDVLKRQLEEARGKLEEVEELLNKAKASLQALDGQIYNLTDRRQTKLFLKEQAEKDRQDALNGIDEALVHEKTEEIGKLGREIQSLEELHEAAIKKRGQAENEVRLLLKKVDGAVHEFWYTASQIECAKVTGNEILLRAWICTQLGRTVQSYGQFLNNFFGSYSMAELEGLRNDLFKEYRGREG